MTTIAKTVDTLVQSFQALKEQQEQKLASLSREMEQKIHTASSDAQTINTKTNDAALNRTVRASKTGDLSMNDSNEYKTAFTTYMRTGEESGLRSLETKSLSSLHDSDGGFMVSPSVVAKLENDLEDASIIRRLSNVMTVTNSSVDLLLNGSGAAVGWTGEEDDREATDTPDVKKLVVPVHEMYAKPRATQKLLDDAVINVEQWLAESVSRRLAEVENNAFLFGDGNQKPKGILTYETAEEASWGQFAHVRHDADADLIDSLVDMFAAIKGEYLSGATWLMSRSTLAAVRKLKDQDGRHIWQPSLDAKSPSTLLGYKVEICDDLENLGGDGACPIIFGNFNRAYQVVDRQGITMLRDPYSAKPYVEFYTTKRVGGDVVNFDALVMLKA